MNGADASTSQPDATPLPDAEPLPDASPGFESLTITQNSARDLIDNSVGCFTRQDGQIVSHGASSFYRLFDPSDFGITSTYVVNRVRVGVRRAASASGDGQPVDLVLGHQASASVPDPDGPNLISTRFNVPDFENSGYLNFSDREHEVPAGQVLYVELRHRSGSEAPEGNDLLMIGVNQEPENAPSFYSSPSCGNEEIPVQPFGDIEPFSENRWVVEIELTHQP